MEAVPSGSRLGARTREERRRLGAGPATRGGARVRLYSDVPSRWRSEFQGRGGACRVLSENKTCTVPSIFAEAGPTRLPWHVPMGPHTDMGPDVDGHRPLREVRNQ